MNGWVLMLRPPSRCAAGDRPDHESGDCVDEDGDKKEGETDLDEGTEVEVACGLGELIGDDTGQGVAGGEEAFADLWVIADDHGNGDGLAKSAAEAEHDGSYDADAGVAQNTDADHLPLGGAEGKDGLALAVGHGHHDVAGQGRDDGQNHDGQDDACREEAYAEVWASEEACPAKSLEEEGPEELAHDRNEHKDSPEAVDHTGDGSQEFSEKGDRGAQGLGAEFGDKDRYSQSQGDRDGQSEKRSYKGSVDEWEGAEVAGDGVPRRAGEEPPAELREAQMRTEDKDGENEENNDEDAARA